MRTREEIESKKAELFNGDRTPIGLILSMCGLILEVVLDCRDILLEQKRGAK